MRTAFVAAGCRGNLQGLTPSLRGIRLLGLRDDLVKPVRLGLGVGRRFRRDLGRFSRFRGVLGRLLSPPPGVGGYLGSVPGFLCCLFRGLGGVIGGPHGIVDRFLGRMGVCRCLLGRKGQLLSNLIRVWVVTRMV